MASYKPPYTINDDILLQVVAITSQVAQLAAHHFPDARPRLRKNNQIKSIHASLRIEANSLPLDDVVKIIDGQPVLGPAKEIREVQNAYRAYEALADFDPYRLADLKVAHHYLTEGLLADAGQFRQGEEGVFDGDRCIFMAPPAASVDGHMQNLFQWMRYDKEKVHPLIMSAVFHYEFLFIHPFSDGNGRLARLWYTALLRHWQPVFEYIPLESQIERFQEGYYRVIADSHKDGSATPFVTFMLRQIQLVLQEVAEASTQIEVERSPSVSRLLACMAEGQSYSVNELLVQLQLRSKDNFRKNYLNPALDAGLIVMTIPEKPRSRNQRYRKTSADK